MSGPSVAEIQAEREAERLAQSIRLAFQRAARATDRSSRNMSRGAGGGRGGLRMPIVSRARRAPSSASQFHVHVKKSKSSGSGKAPISSTNKIRYDLGLDEKDRHKGRVKIAFVSAPTNTPNAARNPLSMAAACEERARKSKYANAHTGQMLHIDVALPNDLSPDRLAQLAGDINNKISQQFAVPSFSGVHIDHGNFHLHSSVPLYEVHDDGRGSFTLGDRIHHAKQPKGREALGLPRSPAGELRELRQDIANLIADALRDELPHDHHAAERWRHGHLTLPLQVGKAALRGDVQFVIDNLNRDATRKEGLPGSRRDAAVAYNQGAGKCSSVPSPELITRTLTNHIIQLAEQAGIDTPEQFRMLSKLFGLNVHWATGREKDCVQGVIFSLDGGPRISGRRVGASLGTLQKKLNWAGRPVYRRFPPKMGVEVMEFKNKLIEVKIMQVDHADYVAKSIKITLHRLKKIEDLARGNASRPIQLNETPIAPAATAKPLTVSAVPESMKGRVVKSDGEVRPVKVRPKRKSNDPSYNRKTTLQAPWEQSANKPPLAVKSPPNPVPLKVLTPEQRELLEFAWDRQEAHKAGVFDGPLTQERERFETLQERLRERRASEPWPTHNYKKKLFGGTKAVETAEHAEWRKAIEGYSQKAEMSKRQIKSMVDQAIFNPKLLQLLPSLEADAAEALRQQQAQNSAAAARSYEHALKILSTARPGSVEAQRAYSAINEATKLDSTLVEVERQRRIKQAQESSSGHNVAPPANNSVAIRRERPR